MELLISAHSHDNGAVNSAQCSLNGSLTLGRGPESPLLLDGSGISREHLRLDLEGGRILITDLSSNGTWVNAHRLTRGEPQPLTHSDEIKIPGFEIRIDLTNISTPEDRQILPPAPVVLQPAEPARAGGPVEFLRVFGASLSTVEKFLLALALSTLALVVLYLAE
jgi:pSer/pThr/pTyr-binding forkhead associated (FHA) protein